MHHHDSPAFAIPLREEIKRWGMKLETLETNVLPGATELR